MAFLGFASKPVDSVAPTACDSYIGGSLIHFEDVAPSPTLHVCKSCQAAMCFLGRIYCPLTDSSYHRMICFFVCLRPKCQETGLNWRVLRSQFLENPQNVTLRSNTEWSVSDEDEEEDWGGDFEAPSEKQTELSVPAVLQGPFMCSFIDVYEENAETCHEELSNVDCASRTSGSPVPDPSSFTAWLQADAVEREFIDEDDNTVPSAFSGMLEMHLATRGEHGCEDVRYWWCGPPVFNGPPPKQLADYLKCDRCGANRVFEVQLFPTLNNHLSLSSCSNEEEHVDFQLPELDKINQDWLLRITTVLVFTCSASCWTEEDKWVEECVVVQTDEDRTCIWDGVSPVFLDKPI